MSLGYHHHQARGECGHCGRTLDQPPYRLCSHCYTPSQKRHTVQQAGAAQQVARAPSVPEAVPHQEKGGFVGEGDEAALPGQQVGLDCMARHGKELPLPGRCVANHVKTLFASVRI